MTTFEVEELQVVLGALEKRVARSYVFKNLPGYGDDDKGPRLTILEKEKVVKEYVGEDLGRIKRMGEKIVKLTFHSDRKPGAISKFMGKKQLLSRTVHFPEEDSDLVSSFVLACRKLNAAAEVDYTNDVEASSDIESKTSMDTLQYPRDSTGRRSPQGSFDVPGESQIGSVGDGTMIEQLGGTGVFASAETGSGMIKGDSQIVEPEDEQVGHVRAPPPNPAGLALAQSQLYSEFMREFSTAPKFFCRVRNRYGMFEGKLLGLVGEEVRFVSLVEQILQEELIQPVSGNVQKEAANDEEEGDMVQMSSILSSLPPSTLSSASLISSETAGSTPAYKQDSASFWSLPKSRITKFVLYGLIGAQAVILLDDGVEIDLTFESAGARKQFTASVFGVKDARVVQLFPGGEECAVQDLQRGWTDFAVVSLKGMGSVRTARTLVMSRSERCFWIFRNTDLLAGLVCESCEPFRSIGIPSAGLSIEMGRSSRTRLKFGLSHTTAIANAPSSSSLVPSVKSDGAEKTHFDMLFPNYFERERFVHHLHGLASTLKVTAPPSQLRAKHQRQAWHRPSLDWFEVRRSMFLGTFNVGDSAPPDPATLDLWVAHPVKVKRDMITGGVKTQTRIRAKSGSAGVTGRFSMYVFGLQECGSKFEDWTKALQNHLGSEFCLVSSTRLWEMGLLVFAALAEVDKISCVETGSVATGRGIAKEVTGMQLGNKGGVAIGLRWRDTSLCFINSHLAPHQEKVLIRNQNFSQIMAKLGLSGGAGDCGELGFEPTHAFEHVFFFGDMNYRVDESFQKVISIASQGKWPLLLSLDQLRKEIETKRCYYNFREAGTPNFPPTYRWERGKRAFSNKRDQPPSYTDRVLVHSRPGLESKVQSYLYGSSQDVMISDHRPVAATFSLALREPYTPWPLHPLVAEIPRRDQADDSSSSDTGKTAAESPFAGVAGLNQPLEREASSDGERTSSARLLGGLMGALESESGPSSAAFNPLFSLAAPESALDPEALVQRREEELRDEDEEDEPDQFLGHLGNFYVTPESFLKELDAAPPEIRLSNVVLKLERREGSDKLPPTFVQLRVSSRILQEIGHLETTPGFEDLARPNEYAFVYETSKEGNAKEKRQWGDLHYVWHNTSQQGVNDSGGSSSANALFPSNEFTALKPTLWDPCYLVSQHLLVVVEEISSSRKKEEARKKASALDVEGEEGMGAPGDSPVTGSSGRKTLTGGSSSDVMNSRLSARLSRRKRSVGTAAMHIGSAIVGAAATAVSGSTTFAGQASIALKPAIDRARKQVAKDAGMANWTRTQPISVEFCEPVIHSGVCIGEVKGVLSLVPGGAEERRQYASSKARAQLVSRVAGRHLEPVFCRQSFDVEVQLDGFNDKKGNLWRRVFAALDTNGTMYIASKAPGGNKSGQAFLDALTRTALMVLDVSESHLDYAVGSASAADRAFTFELTAKKISSSAHDTLASNPRAVVIFSVADDTERRLWGSCIQAVQQHKRFDREFVREQLKECESRKEQRGRRLEIERKRRFDAEQAMAAPPVKQPGLGKSVSFHEEPRAEGEASDGITTPPKSSFLSRAGGLLALKKSTATKEDFSKQQASFRGRWFGARSMGDVLEHPGDSDSPSGASRLAARSGGRSLGETLDEAAVPLDLEKDLDDAPPPAGSSATRQSNTESKKSLSSPQHQKNSSASGGRTSGAAEGATAQQDNSETTDESKMSLAQRLKERAKHSKLRVKKQHSAGSTDHMM